MPVPETLLEVRSYEGDGYKPLVDFGAWRVAVLRSAESLLPENLDGMQRHNETDEVFVLLSGRCILFLGEGADAVSTIHAQDLQPLQIYNVKKACWHTHTLSPGASVLVVENQDTSALNSTHVALSKEQRAEILQLAGKLWP